MIIGRPRVSIGSILVIGILGGIVGTARAVDVPPSAYSSSVLVPSGLLEHAGLLFQYPQRAAVADTQILTLATTTSFSSTDAVGVGANLRSDHVGAFLLSQDFLSTSAPIEMQLLQVGVAGRWGKFRAGLAARGGRERLLNEDQENIFSDPPFIFRFEQVVDYREGAVGLGFGESGSAIDAVVEFFREDLDFDSFRATSSDVAMSIATSNPKVRLAASLRAHRELGRDHAVTAFAGFRDLSVDYDATQTVRPGELEGVNVVDYGHRWEVGLAYGRNLPSGSLGRFHAIYTNSRGPTRIELSSARFRSVAEVRDEREIVRAGFGLERDVWGSFRLLSGIQSSFTVREVVARTESERTENEIEVSLFSDITEFFSHEFAWGLHREFGNLALTGAMRTNLDLDNLFLSIDARLLLE